MFLLIFNSLNPLNTSVASYRNHWFLCEGNAGIEPLKVNQSA